MIYRGPGFLAHPLSRKLARLATHRKTKKERQLHHERVGKGWARSRIMRPQKSLALFKSLYTLWYYLSLRWFGGSIKPKMWHPRVGRSSDGSASTCCKAGRVRFSARHPREIFPTELTNDEKVERNLGKWRRKNVLYKCDGNECSYYKNIKINKMTGIMPSNLFLKNVTQRCVRRIAADK